MNHTQASKHQWQSKLEGTHRVRFFTHMIDMDRMLSDSKVKKFHQVANEFKKTDQYQWVEDNDINLKWMEDDVHFAYSKQVILYGDLTEAQYVDYALRFFRHREDWK
jgi:hypothetical protein